MALKQKPKKRAGNGKKHPALRPMNGAGDSQSTATKASTTSEASVSTHLVDDMTLLKSPFKTGLLFAQICTRSAIDAACNHAFIALSLSAVAVAGYFDVQLRTKDLSGGNFDFREDFSIAGIMYWIGLGFLSSFGMGFGLHTFVLFLAPAIIAHVSHYPEHSILDNYREVWWWSLSWGIGTAIGELPPYWAARAARLQNKRSAELDEEFASTADSGIVGRIKHRIQGMNMGFFSICLFASVPNPLFDLAGLMCGHNLVPFSTFFGATAVSIPIIGCTSGHFIDDPGLQVGKGLIKANLQTFFVLSVFNSGTKGTRAHPDACLGMLSASDRLRSLGHWVSSIPPSSCCVSQVGEVTLHWLSFLNRYQMVLILVPVISINWPARALTSQLMAMALLRKR